MQKRRLHHRDTEVGSEESNSEDEVGRRVPATAFREFNIHPCYDAVAGTRRPTLLPNRQR